MFWSVMWCNAADDALAVALPGPSPQWESQAYLYAHLLSVPEHSSAKDKKWHLYTIHADTCSSET